MLARELRNSLAARVAIWTLEKGGALEGSLTAAGIPWENHPALIDRQGFRKVPALLALIRAIGKWRPDAILPFNDFPNRVCGAIWPWTGAAACTWNQRDEGREVTGRFLERRALRQASIFTANSTQGADFLTGRFGIARERITIIPNGVELAPPECARDGWRTRIGIGPQAIMVTMIANVHHFKDHETLLNAWGRLAGENNEAGAHLVLAGRPGDTSCRLLDLCQRLKIGESVHFIGPTTDVSGLLAASDIGVFSSQLEGMPNGVLECMAAGLPVVATRIAGIAAALGGDYPLLAPPGDAQALARDLMTLIHDAALRERIGRQNKKRARDEFSAEKMGRRHIELLRPFLAEHHERTV